MAVRVENLRKSYGSVMALAGLSFEVASGELFGFMGPNGAGKTTALRLLAGLARPDGGRAEVAGVDVNRHPTLARRLSGYMPDFFGVYDSMTAAEYLGFYAACYRVPRRSAGKVVDDLLALVGLTAKRGAQVDTLSRGMKQRLCLARALVHDPAVLLLDEPGAGLDPGSRAEMRELVRALGEMGKTVVLSSHDLAELAEVCTSFGILHDGRMVACGPAQSFVGSRREADQPSPSLAPPSLGAQPPSLGAQPPSLGAQPPSLGAQPPTSEPEQRPREPQQRSLELQGSLELQRSLLAAYFNLTRPAPSGQGANDTAGEGAEPGTGAGRGSGAERAEVLR